jgi:hypothetical protein
LASLRSSWQRQRPANTTAKRLHAHCFVRLLEHRKWLA